MWHDWALFQWLDEDGDDQLVPGHIVTFVHLDEFHVGLLEDNEHVVCSESGLYAMLTSEPEIQSYCHRRLQNLDCSSTC
jgi:hypothetical protein